MWKSEACEALRLQKCLELRYDGFTRIVEVHTVGVTTAGNDAMSVWQIRGGSQSGERVGWKLLRLDEARGAVLTDEKSQAPRVGYKRGDKRFRVISCQI